MRLVSNEPRKELSQVGSKAKSILPYCEFILSKIQKMICFVEATFQITTKAKGIPPKNISNLKTNYWVPFNALVPCHLVLPSFFHRFVVWTVVCFSSGNSGPRSRFSILLEVDQNQVRFHVSAKCFLIQNAVLKNLDRWTVRGLIGLIGPWIHFELWIRDSSCETRKLWNRHVKPKYWNVDRSKQFHQPYKPPMHGQQRILGVFNANSATRTNDEQHEDDGPEQPGLPAPDGADGRQTFYDRPYFEGKILLKS